jgi:hypothetical protein
MDRSITTAEPALSSTHTGTRRKNLNSNNSTDDKVEHVTQGIGVSSFHETPTPGKRLQLRSVSLTPDKTPAATPDFYKTPTPE